MPKSHAEQQRDYRERQRATSRHQADLAPALGEAQRLALTACGHPSAAIDAGTCRACGTEVW